VRQPPKFQQLSKRENDLLLKINAKPPPWRQTYDRLIQKRRAKELTPGEQRKLLALVDKMEGYNACWLRWLVELAAIRRMTLDDLMKQLRLPKHLYA